MKPAWLVAILCLALTIPADAKRLHLRKPRHGFQMRMRRSSSSPAPTARAATMRWRPVDIHLVQISTHQHRRGTRMSVHQIDSAGNDVGELVTSLDWEHPRVNWFTQGKSLHAGDGLRFTCEWSNPDDHPVHFGVTTEDEMCFVGGYFYPDDEGATVSGPGCLPQASGLECFVPNLPS